MFAFRHCKERNGYMPPTKDPDSLNKLNMVFASMPARTPCLVLLGCWDPWSETCNRSVLCNDEKQTRLSNGGEFFDTHDNANDVYYDPENSPCIRQQEQT